MATSLTVSKQIDASPARVWDVITDLERSSDVISGITKIERLDDGTEFGVGTTWRETRRMMGKNSTEEMTVTEVVAGSSYTVEADSHGAHYTSVMSVAPAGQASTLTMTFGAEPTTALSSIFAKTIGRLFEGTMKKAIEQDLADIAVAATA